MFYCNKCAEEKGYPKSIAKSHGKCELCGNIAVCNDVPSSKLPEPNEIEIKDIHLPVKKGRYPIIDVPANGKPRWMYGAYTLCFVYSKHNGNFILRGYRGEVMEYLKKNYTHYFYYVSMWSNGRSRGHWEFWKEHIGIFGPYRNSRTFKGKSKWKFEVRPYSSYKHVEDGYKDVESLWFKRMPHRWIPEFDKF
jgi:hypothetical protein